MESIAADILYEILLKLPASDVGRCRCVSRRWRCIVQDSSFHRLHAFSVLLVSHPTFPSKRVQNTVLLLNGSRTNPMPMSRIEVAQGYRPASVCNGFIVLASEVKTEFVYKGLECLFVWNPVTGEKLRIPAPPVESYTPDLVAMGFSGAPRRQYKLFRLPKESSTDDNYLHAYTLGRDSGWRRHPDPVQHKRLHWAETPPALVDGKLYVLTKWSHRNPPNRVFVMDVASEARRMYLLMEDYKDADSVTMDAFELAGRLCVAVHIRDQLHLWAMPPPRMVECGHRQPGGGRRQLAKKLPGAWELRYCFNRDHPARYLNHDQSRGAWVEDGGILCCVMGDHLYKYDTSKNDDNKHTNKEEVGGRLAWDQKHQLPLPPDDHRWHIYGGYRPTLLSPRDLETQK